MLFIRQAMCYTDYWFLMGDNLVELCECFFWIDIHFGEYHMIMAFIRLLQLLTFSPIVFRTGPWIYIINGLVYLVR